MVNMITMRVHQVITNNLIVPSNKKVDENVHFLRRALARAQRIPTNHLIKQSCLDSIAGKGAAKNGLFLVARKNFQNFF